MKTSVRRIPNRRIALSAVVALAALAGCGLSRGPAPVQHYVLGGGLVGERAVPGEGGAAVGVRRLQVAPYLLSSSLVVRRGADQVTYPEFHRWAEPLGDGIGRAVAGYLAAGPAVGRAEVAPWTVRTRHDYLVQLHVLRFEGLAPPAPAGDDPAAAAVGEAQVLVAWEILRPADGEVLARGRLDHREPGWPVGDHAALAALLDRGVRALAAQLSAELAGRPGAPAP